MSSRCSYSYSRIRQQVDVAADSQQERMPLLLQRMAQSETHKSRVGQQERLLGKAVEHLIQMATLAVGSRTRCGSPKGGQTPRATASSRRLRRRSCLGRQQPKPSSLASVCAHQRAIHPPPARRTRRDCGTSGDKRPSPPGSDSDPLENFGRLAIRRLRKTRNTTSPGFQCRCRSRVSTAYRNRADRGLPFHSKPSTN